MQRNTLQHSTPTCICAGNLPEDTHHAQQKLQVDILDLFRMVDSAGNTALTGLLPKREIQVLLKGRTTRDFQSRSPVS